MLKVTDFAGFSKRTKVKKTTIQRIPLHEQEFVNSFYRGDKSASIDVSHQSMMYKLRKNPSFLVSEVLVNAQGDVLHVRGCISVRNLSFLRKVRQDEPHKENMGTTANGNTIG